ncbi:MAG: hypothetical protein P4L55_10870 [Syntrophobacteraceae bacterium]|nr:hypothetical protein [Syntrophobacteraceae bacterium]
MKRFGVRFFLVLGCAALSPTYNLQPNLQPMCGILKRSRKSPWFGLGNPGRGGTPPNAENY